MKVLHVVPGLGARTGGPAVTIVESSLAMARVGCEIESTIMATDLPATAATRGRGSINPEALPEGADQLDIRLYRYRFPRRLAFSPAMYRDLSRMVGDYDVVHIHSLWLFPQYAAYKAATRNNVPIVISPRGALDPWLRERGRGRKALTNALWQDDLFNQSKVIHVTSPIEGELIADIAPSTPRMIVPNGIDWERFADLPASAGFR